MLLTAVFCSTIVLTSCGSSSEAPQQTEEIEQTSDAEKQNEEREVKKAEPAGKAQEAEKAEPAQKPEQTEKAQPAEKAETPQQTEKAQQATPAQKAQTTSAEPAVFMQSPRVQPAQPATPAEVQSAESATPAEPAQPAEQAKDNKQIAIDYIGQSASSLQGAIGSPSSTDYSSSCLGDGEDGEWRYNGFTVYTYRENGAETVTDVQ